VPCYELNGKRPRVAADAWIAPTAVLIGDVIVHAKASVWFGAVLRADGARIEIGERSNVQDNCVIHVEEGVPTVLGSDVTVGHGALVHSSIVGSNVLIGSCSTLVGGNRVGDGTLIAAGAVMGEGAEAPAGVLMRGAPAKAVRPVGPEDERWTHHASATYLVLSDQARATLREVEPERL